ncbi:proton channel OtopLc-like [Babylonia areolata]|uniref:proton channel OtopLc-like n=1 Tax=Babylonia areolata TaxID=304850 RepID=UPI003FCF191C
MMMREQEGGEGGDRGLSQHACGKMAASAYRSALTGWLSGLYGLLVVVVGVVLAVASSLPTTHPQPLRFCLEVFLLYLYLGGVAALLFLQLVVMGGRQQRADEESEFEPSEEPTEGSSAVAPLDSAHFRFRGPAFRPSHLVLPPSDGMARAGEGINFYLRLGAVGFSLGSMTRDGLHVTDHHMETGALPCRSPLSTPLHLAHPLLTFLQTFFLFKSHKVEVARCKAAARLGLMHLLSTNLCVWVATVIAEAAEDYRQQESLSPSSSLSSSSHVENQTSSSPPEICHGDLTLARTASPFLSPCTVIYSIIAAGILFRMYTCVGVKVGRRWSSHASFVSSVARQGAVDMDCEKANKGLFSGLLVAVATLIAIATVHVLDTRMNNPVAAAKVFLLVRVCLLLLTGVGLLSCLHQFQRLGFRKEGDSSSQPWVMCKHQHQQHHHQHQQQSPLCSLEAALLLTSLGGGVYLDVGFRLLTSALHPSSPHSPHAQGQEGVWGVGVAEAVLGLLQSSLQAVVVLHGLGRRAGDEAQVRAKPGRGVLTFVLVGSLALCLLTLTEPLAALSRALVLPLSPGLAFRGGALPGILLLHVCRPLRLLFRFHSAVCLTTVWHRAYTKGD